MLPARCPPAARPLPGRWSARSRDASSHAERSAATPDSATAVSPDEYANTARFAAPASGRKRRSWRTRTRCDGRDTLSVAARDPRDHGKKRRRGHHHRGKPQIAGHDLQRIARLLRCFGFIRSICKNALGREHAQDDDPSKVGEIGRERFGRSPSRRGRTVAAGRRRSAPGAPTCAWSGTG